ncbi:MAG TPA: SPFH domain-containing protein, partial [Candidatus Paceibacterota bacterium]|nr:SPFH domain-containing protein [Candidatus Paceibacterota bacterium]
MKSANNVTEEFFANLAKGKKWFFLAFWLAVIVFLLATSYFTVPADSIAVVQRFGKYIGTAEPGLHFKIPGGVDQVTLIPVRRQQKLEFGYGTAHATNPYQD